MNYSSAFGIGIGFGAIAGAFILKGSHISALLNFQAFIIVIVGSYAAVMIQTPPSVIKQAWHLTKWLLFPPPFRFSYIITLMKSWAKDQKTKGLLSVEDSIYRLKDPFMIEATKLMLAHSDKALLKSLLENKIIKLTERDLEAADVLYSMGGYAPTLGILGAVLGLIQVMQNLTDPSLLGSGIAVAFVATVYGVASANLLFIPLANRIKSIITIRARYYEMFLVGLLAVHQGCDFRRLELIMKGYKYESDE